MPCHGCASKFGLWTKEIGCPACGFSFCSSCLKHKCVVPKLDNKIGKVCKLCFNSLSNTKEEPSPSNMSSVGGPPDIFLKRLEALDGPPKPPITVYRTAPRMQTLIKGLNSTDLEIVRRLERLREERQAAKNVPSEDEIARRLAVLRGQDTNESPRKLNYTLLAPDTRSSEEQTQDLFKQFKEEVDIDAKIPKPEDDIALRLNRLRDRYDSSNQESPVPDRDAKVSTSAITLDEIAQLLAQCKMEATEQGKQPDLVTIASLEKLRTRLVQRNEMNDGPSSDEDEETAAAKILAKVQAEVDLERNLGISSDEDNEVMETENDDLEELPWCIICNEDAKVRCLSCDRDLYCQSCFHEGHLDEDMKTHAFEPYKKK